MQRFFSVVLFAVLSASASSAQVVSLDSAAVRQWREDLAFLRKEAPARHANLFHAMSRVQFDSALNSIDTRLPTLARHQVVVELQKLATLIGDGHTNVGPWRDSLIAFHTLPVALYWFSDGIIVRAADSAHANLLGARVVAINGIPVDSVAERLRPLVSHDNEMGVRAFTPFFMVMPEILQATGIVSDMRRIPFTLESAGRGQDVVLEPARLFPMLTGDIDRSWLNPPGWVDARDGKPSALWLSDPMNFYWYKYLAESRTLYAQINTIQQKRSDSLGVFIARAIASADSAHAEKFVLDLRLNGGGDGYFNRSILLPLIKSQYDVRGRLYVITGRRTWSAAQMLVTEMQKYTNATFVGEPTASKGNAFGDSYRIVLPNSKITFRVSTLWWQYLDPRDKRDMIEPAIKSALSFQDYANGRDPVLQSAVTATGRVRAASN